MSRCPPGTRPGRCCSVSDPTVEAYPHYAGTATGSYPFGAGDGCHALRGSGDCGPGSGCTTGAGSLESTAIALGGAGQLLRVLRRDRPASPGAVDGTDAGAVDT